MAGAIARTALVTGGAKRVGRAIAEDLAANGYAVAIHCHSSRDAAEDLAAKLRSKGTTAAVVAGDLTDLDGLADIVEEASSALGPLGVLVNNAALFGDDGFETMSPDAFRTHMAINAAAPAFLTQAFARQVADDAGGVVVNITDQRVEKPVPTHFAYGASKAALAAMTETMAQALAPRIRVNAIAPGPTLQGERQSEDDFRRQVDGVLLKTGPSLDAFGATVRYFVDMPSITGQTVFLDGGQHLGWQTPDVLNIQE
ncbi:SDR family oxidoreductase [Amorphus orientalis]|uniref:NAD(P)-dependent dehydrogenase (Short-subunit alcohol dehydrogenase family) n=1 Tax=Amorphus orientalis TaxID=649198 RepID=A0AAE3VR10_9HYPH|nr:SDR family oxidoreductase [Amorphus orientalis]MDQ0316757.1 NAD(P)-dependent dehydrogenase (short-subunit alcohol dehydrogenase family) [Amorphus orientalis]